MKCPSCGSGLITTKIGDEEVNQCQNCHGHWFDKGKLRSVKDDIDEDLVWLDFDVWTADDGLEIVWSQRQCPKCHKKMATISYGTTGEMVDYCLDGDGIWLDKGEFENIIDSLEQEVISKSGSEYVKVAIEEAKEVLTGPENIISEWKDFSTVTKLLQLRFFAENPKLMEALIAFQKSNPIK
jgi:Zn-finger nucleic acid-binding protein